MALSDLSNLVIECKGSKMDASLQDPVREAVLQGIHDKSNDVQTRAVKWYRRKTQRQFVCFCFACASSRAKQ
jgi:hypothetical protein